jgi:HNH endonuclease
MANHHVGANEYRYQKNRAAYRARCEREDTPCMWCLGPIMWSPPFPYHKKAFTVEHLVSRVEGGSRDDPANWGCAHYSCNSRFLNRPRGPGPTPVNPTTVQNPKSQEWP